MEEVVIRPSDERSLAERLPDELVALSAYARRLVASARAPLDPADLVQDVMERALRYRHSHDPARPLQPWLRRMALNAFLDARAAWLADPCRPGAVAASDPAAPAGRDALDDRERLAGLLARLPEPARTILQRFHAEGASIAQLAAELGLPAGTVKSHLHRARRRLAALPDPDDEGKPRGR